MPIICGHDSGFALKLSVAAQLKRGCDDSTYSDFDVAVTLGAAPALWELALGQADELGCEPG